MTDLAGIRQEDGRYAIALNSSKAEAVGRITVRAVMKAQKYAIETSAQPEQGGTITCAETSAQKGETLTYTVSSSEGYYCSAVQLCTSNSVQMLSTKNGQGTFVMPAKDVVVKAIFTKPTYTIDTKDSENLKLSVAVADSSNYRYAAKGDAVAIHYTKTSWSADEKISLYRAAKDASGEYLLNDANLMQYWIAKGAGDDPEDAMTFVMPGEDVVLVSEPMDDVSYTLTPIVEGSGTLVISDTINSNKEEAYQGEKIYVDVYPDQGWSVDRDNSYVYDDLGNRVNVGAVQENKHIAFAMPAENLTIKAAFVENDYKITVEASADGSIQVLDEKGNAVDLNKVHYHDCLKIKVTDDRIDAVHYKATGEAEAEIYTLYLDGNNEAEMLMPTNDITLSEGAVIDQDENGVYQISTFDELKQIAKIVEKNRRADFEITNNITGDGETLTSFIGSGDQPYGGTFDGHGYYLSNFNIASEDDDAALFDTISSEGTVKRLNIFNVKVNGKRSAGIAVINRGIIDECISGFNMVGPYNDKDGTNRNLSEFNSFVTGEKAAGGVVVENYGIIRNTVNYVQTATNGEGGIAGGIAAFNAGKIENVYTRGKITADGPDSMAGGIVGSMMEQGNIEIAYAVPEELTGSITGAIYGQKKDQPVNHTYYMSTAAGEDAQGIAMLAEEMQTQTFADTLNAQVGTMSDKEVFCSWYWQSSKNLNYPVLAYSTLVQKQVYQTQRGVTVEGKMHEDAQISLNQLDEKNAIYKAFAKYAKEKGLKVQFAARPFLQYANGDPAAYINKLKLSLDTSKYEGKNFKVLLYRDGKVEEIDLNAEKLASAEIEELMPFAVLSEKEVIKKDPSSGTDDKKTPTKTDKKTNTSKSGKTAKTGDSSPVVLWCLVLAAAGTVIGINVVLRKKRKIK